MNDSAPMPDKLTDRELLIAQCVVLFARAARYQADLDFLEKALGPYPTKDEKETVEEKRLSRNAALLALWGPLLKLIDSTPDWAERLK